VDEPDAEAGAHARRRGRRIDKGGPESRERALGMLADMIARDGSAAFLLPPVVPGDQAFPDPWAPTAVGVQVLLRRLAWHAGLAPEVVIAIDDRRVGAPPTERKPASRIELTEVRANRALFTVTFVGTDDVPGALALEIGTLWAITHRPEQADPYRTAEAPILTVDSERDQVRGAVACVYRGLGVLVANAAYQQYVSPGRFNGIYVPHEYDVIMAGPVPMSTLAYLVAVQAIVRGDREPPAGLAESQRDEVVMYMKGLASERAALCEQLGIPTDASAQRERESTVPFADIDDVHEEAPRKNAFRWQTNRGGIGFIAGTFFGIGLSFAVSRGLMPFAALGGATAGHVVGRKIHTPRCSACASVVRGDATTCPVCGAALRGDIATLADRLEAEEQLDRDERL
jgi:hypothetical protein